MTLPAQAAFISYATDGVTASFPFPWFFEKATDLRVWVNGTPTTTGFSVTGAGEDGGGAVVFAVAPATAGTVAILRQPVIEQPTDFINNTTIRQEAIELSLDRAATIDQWLSWRVDRTIRSEDATGISPLPPADQRAGLVLGFDEDGEPEMRAPIEATGAIADQPTAEAGNNNTKLMTPLRVAQVALPRNVYDPQGVAANVYDSSNQTSFTRNQLASKFVPSSVKSLRTNGLDAPDDGLACNFIRVDAQPSADGLTSFRSSDRFRADGVQDSANGGWWIYNLLKGEALSPFAFGAKGDGVADDGPALNRMFAYLRAQLALRPRVFNSGFSVDLQGGTYRTTIAINATGLVGWSVRISGGLFYGECTGKPILDLSGSRGLMLDNVAFHGHTTNRPACAYQIARTTESGFCDNNTFCEVSTTGHYSRAAIHCYAHETTLHVHCTYYNYSHDSPVAIFEGYNGHGITSDYATILTGGHSFINNEILNCDFRYLPLDANIATITAVSNAPNGVFTTSAPHSFQIGDEITFAGVGGMPGLAKLTGTVTNVTSNTVTTDVNTSALGSFTSGGYVIRRQTVSSVYLERAKQFRFSNSYIVGFGRPQLELAFVDTAVNDLVQIKADLLFEGSGNTSNIHINSGNATDKTIQAMDFDGYNSNATTSLFSYSGSATVAFHGLRLRQVKSLYTHKLALPANKFAFLHADILFSSLAEVEVASYIGFTGTIGTLADGKHHSIGAYFDLPYDQTYSPTVTASTGAITTVGAKSIVVRLIGRRLYKVDGDVTITTAGTGADNLLISLPFTAARITALASQEIAVSGRALNCRTSGTTLILRRFDNTTCIADGARVIFSGIIEV